MRTILVVNPKGGCGKSTIATNLAGYYATKGVSVTLVDLDQQRSSYQWVMSRPESAPKIKVVTEQQENYDCKRVIYDCPAQIHIGRTTDLINESDVIVMPINPSVIDHRAAFKFIFDVRGMIRADVCKKIQIGMVANRSNTAFNSYNELQKFSTMMQTPVITSLRTSQNYVIAAEAGLSIFEMPQSKVTIDKEQWKPLSYWAEGKLLRKRA
jgi:ATPases involved in chromosome partitioning